MSSEFGIVVWIVIAIVAFIVLKMVIGAVKSSVKMILMLAVLLAAGFGWLWWQSNLPGGQVNPNSPGPEYSWSAGP